MISHIRLFTAATLLLASVIGIAANDSISIVKSINASGIITVTNPELLKSRLLPVVSTSETENTEDSEVTPTAPTKVAGYRVQVFSDNNPRTAKNEARTKAKDIAEAFPQYATYVTYTSPYWRLKVGDFLTNEEAQVVAELIKKQFPDYSHEIRVVRDRVNKQQ